ncbi:MAG: hypothetical protein ACK5P5_07965, partial [Pseudobdellovibrionaceae bacterium]
VIVCKFYVKPFSSKKGNRMAHLFLKIFPIFLQIIFLSHFSHSQQKCENVLSSLPKLAQAEMTVARTLYDEMLKLEEQLKRREWLNGNSNRAILNEIRGRTRQMVLSLRVNEAHVILNMYRSLFRDTEIAFLKLKQLENEISELMKDPVRNQNEISRLDAEVIQHSEIFGRNYTEYSITRKILEAIVAKDAATIQDFNIGVVDSKSAPIIESTQQQPNRPASDAINNLAPRFMNDSLNRIDLENPDVVRTASYLLSRLGVDDLQNTFPQLFPQNVTPEMIATMTTLPEIQRYYSRNPRVIIAKLRHDLQREGNLIYKVVSYSLVSSLNSAQSLMNRLPARLSRAIFWLSGLMRDQYLVDVHLDKVERVINLRGTIENKLDLLMDLSANHTNDEMLVTFARIAVFSRGWVQLKAVAENAGGVSPLYKDFFDRMTEAEKVVREHGHLSLYGRRVFSMQGPTFLISTTYGLYEFMPQIQQTLLSLGAYLGISP